MQHPEVGTLHITTAYFRVAVVVGKENSNSHSQLFVHTKLICSRSSRWGVILGPQVGVGYMKGKKI